MTISSYSREPRPIFSACSRQLSQLVSGVIESALLSEDDSFQQIYPGDEQYPQLDCYNPALDAVEEKQKIDFLLSLEPMAKAKDPRIMQLAYNAVVTASSRHRIVNTHGLDLKDRDNIAYAYASAVAKEGDKVATGMGMTISRDFDKLEAEKIVNDAVDKLRRGLITDPIWTARSSSEFTQVYNPDEFDELYRKIEMMVNDENRLVDVVYRNPVDAGQMDAVKEHLDFVNIVDIVKHQSVIRLENSSNFRCMFDEYFVAVKDLNQNFDKNLLTNRKRCDIISKSSGTRHTREHSSAGRASALQAEGHRFEPCCSHQFHKVAR